MLKSRNLSEEKKTHPEHKYSVTFVSKVGTKNIALWWEMGRKFVLLNEAKKLTQTILD